MSAPSWTIAELEERVARALAGADAPDSGRVRAVPDERAIRYYTTLGLLDRPSMRGRTALYGARHLAQVVAIKRMQVRGKSLAEIQHELPALDDAALATWSGIELAPAPRPRTRASFWKTAPKEVEAGDGRRDRDRDRDRIGDRDRHPSLVEPALRIELDLGGGVRVSFTPARPLTDGDILALRIASAPVLAHLVDRGLVA